MNQKSYLFLLFLSIFIIKLHAQITFEKGYFIDISDQKTNCLIKNVDWRDNPIEFEYKLTENSKVLKADIHEIKEFGIFNSSKYQRFKVSIDKSPETISNMDINRNPVFEEEILFLKVLVDGYASLYFFREGNLTRFFFKKDNSTVQQLVYKRYRFKTLDGDIAENNKYKQQLFTDIKCKNISKRQIENIKYRESDLVRIFIMYNNCNNSQYTTYESNQERNHFNVSIKPGFNNSSLSIKNSYETIRDTNFENQIGFRFGVEFEYIFPFNSNKWSIFIEPAYQNFKSSKEEIIYEGTLFESKFTSKVDYKSVEIPLALRYYAFLDDNNKLYLNMAYILAFDLNSKISFDIYPDLDISTRNNLMFGIGFNHKNKYSLELRYATKREVLSTYQYWNSSYKNISIIFGYSLFSN